MRNMTAQSVCHPPSPTYHWHGRGRETTQKKDEVNHLSLCEQEPTPKTIRRTERRRTTERYSILVHQQSRCEDTMEKLRTKTAIRTSNNKGEEWEEMKQRCYPPPYSFLAVTWNIGAKKQGRRQQQQGPIPQLHVHPSKNGCWCAVVGIRTVQN